MNIWVPLAVVFFLASLVVHEAGHALALRKLGIPISSAGLGLMIPPMLRWRRSTFDVTLSPWLLGAYVLPDRRYEAKLEALSYRDSAWYSGAGIIANLILAGVFGTTAATVDGHLQSATTVGAATVAIWVFRRFIAAALLVPIGIAAAVLTVQGILLAARTGASVGIVGTAQFIGGASSLHAALITVAVLNAAIALFNSIPLFPLDGGRIADALVRKVWGVRPAAVIQNVGVGLMLLVTLYAVGTDAWQLIR